MNTTHQPPVPIVFHEHIHSEIARADDLGDVIYLLSVFTAFLNVPVNSVWRSTVVIQGSGIGIYLLFSTFTGSGMDIYSWSWASCGFTYVLGKWLHSSDGD